jgi:type I restriction enzyme R subunit
MMSNFSFLEPEFKSLAATAKEAEKLVYISPQFALAAARSSLKTLCYGCINTIKN